MSEHNIHSDDEIELKKETAGIDDSVTGVNELHQPLHFSYVVQPV